ncbi:hypothetical protein K469DRAFT_744547 [Zopfia rhizophila CBS 207.26]|uniref:MADS-box domain-containing protein n=1 Tax=Zopfia rhizophila CBS 207.26 TaxID=1314779 RepID=A0A6A6EUP3_9PEZI|nr:hypothetical protein K469DRAFT_744547 [Zopfia rhizophila CBS 207.26]
MACSHFPAHFFLFSISTCTLIPPSSGLLRSLFVHFTHLRPTLCSCSSTPRSPTALSRRFAPVSQFNHLANMPVQSTMHNDKLFKRRKEGIEKKACFVIREIPMVKMAIIYQYGEEITVFRSHPHISDWPPSMTDLKGVSICNTDMGTYPIKVADLKKLPNWQKQMIGGPEVINLANEPSEVKMEPPVPSSYFDDFNVPPPAASSHQDHSAPLNPAQSQAPAEHLGDFVNTDQTTFNFQPMFGQEYPQNGPVSQKIINGSDGHSVDSASSDDDDDADGEEEHSYIKSEPIEPQQGFMNLPKGPQFTRKRRRTGANRYTTTPPSIMHSRMTTPVPQYFQATNMLRKVRSTGNVARGSQIHHNTKAPRHDPSITGSYDDMQAQSQPTQLPVRTRSQRRFQ